MDGRGIILLMTVIQIDLASDEYERLCRVAAHTGETVDAVARRILRSALERWEATPAERLLHAVESVYRQYGTPHTPDTTVYNSWVSGAR